MVFLFHWPWTCPNDLESKTWYALGLKATVVLRRNLQCLFIKKKIYPKCSSLKSWQTLKFYAIFVWSRTFKCFSIRNVWTEHSCTDEQTNEQTNKVVPILPKTLFLGLTSGSYREETGIYITWECLHTSHFFLARWFFRKRFL